MTEQKCILKYRWESLIGPWMIYFTSSWWDAGTCLLAWWLLELRQHQDYSTWYPTVESCFVTITTTVNKRIQKKGVIDDVNKQSLDGLFILSTKVGCIWKNWLQPSQNRSSGDSFSSGQERLECLNCLPCCQTQCILVCALIYTAYCMCNPTELLR